MRLSRPLLRYGRALRADPSHPDGRIPPQARLRPFPVIEQDGLVWVWPGDPEKAAAARPPRLPEIADPARETADTGPMAVPANTVLLIENLLDITHFYPLHDGNIGDVENSRIPVRLDEGERDGNPMSAPCAKRAATGSRPFSKTISATISSTATSTHYLLSPAVTHVRDAGLGRPAGTAMPASSAAMSSFTPIRRWTGRTMSGG